MVRAYLIILHNIHKYPYLKYHPEGTEWALNAPINKWCLILVDNQSIMIST
jgi:hypothetical protein